MKPMIFKTESELVKFIDSLPVASGSAKVGGRGELTSCKAILAEIKTLAPAAFRYKVVLASAQGGLGNKKSIDRFSSLAAANVIDIEKPRFEAALEDLRVEVEGLLNIGVSDEVADQLKSAKSMIAQFQMMKNIILSFKQKLQDRMAVVEKAAEKMNGALASVVKKEKNSELKSELVKIEATLESNLKEIRSLMKALDRYCDLMVAFNSTFIKADAA